MNKTLRYYQTLAAEAVKNALLRTIKRCLVVMPGGTGKSLAAVNIIKDYKRKLWITHEESLLEQSAIALLVELELMPDHILIETISDHGGLISMLRYPKKCKSLTAIMISKQIGLVKADMIDWMKPIVMASAQSLYKHLDKIPRDHFDAIVVDEADLFLSKTFREPLEYFTYDLLLGLTATPYRLDGLLLDDIFDELVYEYKIEQAIADGYLTELNAIVIKSSINLDKVHTSAGDFKINELQEAVNTPERNNLIVSKYLEYCSGQQFICFGVDTQHVIDLNEAFREKGIYTEYVVSDKTLISESERKRISSGYKKGEIIGLVNITIYAVGYDAPNTGCVIMGRPTKSKRLFLQSLFRVTRLKDAEFVAKFGQIGTILDVVDGTSKHKLINTHELDKELPIEDRVFLSRKNKDRLLKAKQDRMMAVANREKDVKVKLYELPKVKLIFSQKYSEPATEGQLKVLERLEYDIVNNSYNKFQCAQIIGDQPASQEEVNNLISAGYNVSRGVTRTEAMKAFRDIGIRDAKANAIKYRNK